jgi:hypothetical protein
MASVRLGNACHLTHYCIRQLVSSPADSGMFSAAVRYPEEHGTFRDGIRDTFSSPWDTVREDFDPFADKWRSLSRYSSLAD